MPKTWVYLAFVFLLLAAPHPKRTAQRPARIKAVSLPLAFESNQGQLDPAVRFFARTRGGKLLFTDTEAIVQPRRGAPVHVRLAGANPGTRIGGRAEQRGRSNYFVGKDPLRWRTSIPTFGKVAYEGVYSGIDLLYYGSDGRLEFDFVVAPGSDPRSIALQFDGGSVAIGSGGELRIGSGGGEISFARPDIYQESRGIRQSIAGGYVLRDGGRVGFDIGTYDRGLPLVIDPVLLGFSSYLGGAGGESADAIAQDALGNIYVTGYTDSEDFPGGVPAAVSLSGPDVFVAKFNPDASALLGITFVGGSSSEFAHGIGVDAAGNVYVAGETYSDDFPTLGAYQSKFGEGYSDAFLFKVDSKGALVFSTFLGGRGADDCAGLALDASANVYLVGGTDSTDFPTTPGAFDRTCGTDGDCNAASFGGSRAGDAFVTKFDSAGKLVYSTYLGGAGPRGTEPVASRSTALGTHTSPESRSRSISRPRTPTRVHAAGRRMLSSPSSIPRGRPSSGRHTWVEMNTKRDTPSRSIATAMSTWPAGPNPPTFLPSTRFNRTQARACGTPSSPGSAPTACAWCTRAASEGIPHS